MVEMRLAGGAFPAILARDGETHDGLVWGTISDLTDGVDVVVLAQASMARVLDSASRHEIQTPIQASPSLALDRLARVVFPKTKAA